MDKFQLQKLRDLPIEGVAERLGLRVCRHKSLCPFHDDHKPSLTFSVRRNTFRCWSCGEHGGTIDLALKLLPLGGGREGAAFHMYPDRDEPGERLFLQLQQILPGLEHHQLPPDCKDYSEYYLKLKIKNEK